MGDVSVMRITKDFAVSNLPRDAIVEVPAQADAGDVHPFLDR